MSELTYTERDGYLIPDVAIRETPPLGIYGMKRKNYLREQRPILYNKLVLKEELFPHCLEVEQAAHERLDLIMSELQAKDPPPDKATDPIGWAAHMNSLKAQAEEVINTELIYS